jgi:hypothetical protein
MLRDGATCSGAMCCAYRRASLTRLLSELSQEESVPTHLLVLSQTLLRLRELVALSLLGHSIIVVRSHGGRAGRS